MRLATFLGVGFVFAASLDAQEGTKIHIAPIAFQNEELVERAIITDCDLPNVQLAALQEAAAERGLTLSAERDGAGRVLEIQIVTAVAGGNAFMGHQKQVTLVGKLLESGQQIASFSATRSSGGGAFGGFKGSCGVLHRCAEALGSDIASWLAKPTANARLGELR